MGYCPQELVNDKVREDIATDIAKGFEVARLTTTQRDQLSGLNAGTLIWNTTTSELQLYNGTGWDVIAIVQT